MGAPGGLTFRKGLAGACKRKQILNEASARLTGLGVGGRGRKVGGGCSRCPGRASGTVEMCVCVL